MKLNLDNVFKPKFFGLFKKGRYSKDRFISDLIAGIIVGIIALPLAIAFGIASGVTPQQGLITAIVAGVLVSIFGGFNFLIGGPTGAFIVIVYGIVAKFGFNGLMIATIMAGVLLVLMGIFKIGNIIKFIPYPIVVGFTSGIALVIFTTQIKDFFGLQIAEVPSGFIPQWICYISNLKSINIAELLLGLVCLLTIIFWPKVTKKVPGSLIAIAIGVIASVAAIHIPGVTFTTIGDKFPELSLGLTIPEPNVPKITFENAKDLFSPAFTIAILCAIESLLAAMVADGVTGKKHNSNTELIGQGVANIITPIFGGMPATGAIARTMANINNGGKTPVAGVIHAVVLLLILLFFMPLAQYIPMACLAGVLVIVSYNMSGWRTFKALLKNPKSDVTVLFITFLLTVIFDLTVAIEVGLVIACVLFMRRVMETTEISVIKDEIDPNNDTDATLNEESLTIPKGVEVYEINGPYFFGIATRFEETMAQLGDRPKVRIIRMRKVPFIDSTGIHNLTNLCRMSKRENIHIILSGVNEKVHNVLEKSGFYDLLGEDNICKNINEALEKAEKIVSK